MRSFAERYGGSPGHLVAVLAGGALAAYAVTRVADLPVLVGIALWFGFLLVAHDLLLFPVYAALDRLIARLGGPGRTAVPWVNHVRVPSVLSGLLLLAWFPLILRLPAGYPRITGRSLDPFLGRWLAVTAVLFAGSGLLYAGRLLRQGVRRSGRAAASRPGRRPRAAPRSPSGPAGR